MTVTVTPLAITVGVLVTSLLCYLLKLVGLALPKRVLEHPYAIRLGALLPISLLSALVAVQTFASGTTLTIDARAAGVAVAAVALMLRAPFLLVVILATVTSALIRLIA
jgi:hypothetical protein